MSGCRVVVVVPCYNESQRLDRAAFRTFAARHPDVRMLLVNDGSTDVTLALLEDLCAGQGQFEVLDLPQNGGKAEAVRQGMLAARGAPLVAYWDADLATPLEAILPMCDVLERRPDIDIVAGVRLPLLGRTIQRRPLRRLLGRGFAWCASRALGVAMVDTQCGAKMFRQGDALAAALAAPFGSRWIFDVELLVRWRLFLARTTGESLAERLYEFPLERWYEVAGSHLRPRDFVRAVGELLAIYWQAVKRPASLMPEVTLPLVAADGAVRPTTPPPRTPVRRAA